VDDELLLAPIAELPNSRHAERLARTTQALRWHGRWRQVRQWLAAGGLFGLGIVVGWWCQPTALAPQIPVPTAVAPPAPPEWARPAEPPLLSASGLEEQAEQANGRQAWTLFRQAGDAYAAWGDWRAALRCYRNALDLASPQDLQPTPDDSWLVLALKRQRLQETTHVPTVP
jgi:hypothetical protein